MYTRQSRHLNACWFRARSGLQFRLRKVRGSSQVLAGPGPGLVAAALGPTAPMVLVLAAAAVVLLVAMLAHQGLSLIARGPSAGLNTESGLPEDRMDIRHRALLRQERVVSRSL